MPLWTLQPLRMKKGDQPGVAALFVQQVVEGETDRGGHRNYSEKSGLFQRLPQDLPELQPGPYMSRGMVVPGRRPRENSVDFPPT